MSVGDDVAGERGTVSAQDSFEFSPTYEKLEQDVASGGVPASMGEGGGDGLDQLRAAIAVDADSGGEAVMELELEIPSSHIPNLVPDFEGEPTGGFKEQVTEPDNQQDNGAVQNQQVDQLNQEEQKDEPKSINDAFPENEMVCPPLEDVVKQEESENAGEENRKYDKMEEEAKKKEDASVIETIDNPSPSQEMDSPHTGSPPASEMAELADIATVGEKEEGDTAEARKEEEEKSDSMDKQEDDMEVEEDGDKQDSAQKEEEEGKVRDHISCKNDHFNPSEETDVGNDAFTSSNHTEGKQEEAEVDKMEPEIEAKGSTQEHSVDDLLDINGGVVAQAEPTLIDFSANFSLGDGDKLTEEGKEEEDGDKESESAGENAAEIVEEVEQEEATGEGLVVGKVEMEEEKAPRDEALSDALETLPTDLVQDDSVGATSAGEVTSETAANANSAALFEFGNDIFPGYTLDPTPLLNLDSDEQPKSDGQNQKEEIAAVMSIPEDIFANPSFSSPIDFDPYKFETVPKEEDATYPLPTLPLQTSEVPTDLLFDFEGQQSKEGGDGAVGENLFESKGDPLPVPLLQKSEVPTELFFDFEEQQRKEEGHGTVEDVNVGENLLESEGDTSI